MTSGTKRKPAKPVAPSGKKAAAKGKLLAKNAGSGLPPGAGPVTLTEARTLALVQRTSAVPKSLAKARGAATPASTAPTSAGAQRARRQSAQREEITRRLREYKATLAIMKKRGARRAPPKPAGRAKALASPVTAGESFMPLQILAEGDSWFDYPVPLFGGGIVPRLEGRLGVPILNLAKAGDEVRYMLGVEERSLLARMLSDGCPAGGPWDVLLFSGGGNDIVDNPMALWVRDWNPALTPAEHLHSERFDAALALVRAGYEDLIALRDTLSPQTHLVFHAYDYALPDGRGVCLFGPWLKPTFELRGFPDQATAWELVKAMLARFAAMLSTLVASTSKCSFINGQGSLEPVRSAWHNELHPSRRGFESFADLFYTELQARFPSRVA